MPEAQVLQFETQAARGAAVESVAPRRAGRAPHAMYMAAQNSEKFKAGSEASARTLRPGDPRRAIGMAVLAQHRASMTSVTGLRYPQFATMYKKWFGKTRPRRSLARRAVVLTPIL